MAMTKDQETRYEIARLEIQLDEVLDAMDACEDREQERKLTKHIHELLDMYEALIASLADGHHPAGRGTA